jgi:hypothetical protein
MSTICPKDGQPCCDDMCLGSGVCGLTGSELWDYCPLCRTVYSREYDVDCACEPDYDYREEDQQ